MVKGAISPLFQMCILAGVVAHVRQPETKILGFVGKRKGLSLPLEARVASRRALGSENHDVAFSLFF